MPILSNTGDRVEARWLAISTKLSTAPRAMPNAFAENKASATGNQARGRYKVLVCIGGSASDPVLDAGTNTSSTTKSWLPLPRMPITDHVSMNVAAAAGTHMARVDG